MRFLETVWSQSHWTSSEAELPQGLGLQANPPATPYRSAEEPETGGESEVRPCRINTACGMDQFIKHNNEKTPVLEFNLTTRAGTKKTEVGLVVLLQAAVCQESGPTCTLWAQTNTDRRMSCGLVI